MKLDCHVHSIRSGFSSIRPLHRVMRECCTTPESVYRVAKALGMDLVTITCRNVQSKSGAKCRRTAS